MDPTTEYLSDYGGVRSGTGAGTELGKRRDPRRAVRQPDYLASKNLHLVAQKLFHPLDHLWRLNDHVFRPCL
jgi:hypothetical protein